MYVFQKTYFAFYDLYYSSQSVPFECNFRSTFLSPSLKCRLKVLVNMGPELTDKLGFQWPYSNPRNHTGTSPISKVEGMEIGVISQSKSLSR